MDGADYIREHIQALNRNTQMLSEVRDEGRRLVTALEKIVNIEPKKKAQNELESAVEGVAPLLARLLAGGRKKR